MPNWLGRLGARLFGRYFGGAEAPAPRPWRSISSSSRAAFSLALEAQQARLVKADTRSGRSLVSQTWLVFAETSSRSARHLVAATAPSRLRSSSRVARRLVIGDRAASLGAANIAALAPQSTNQAARDLTQQSAAAGALELT